MTLRQAVFDALDKVKVDNPSCELKTFSVENIAINLIDYDLIMFELAQTRQIWVSDVIPHIEEWLRIQDTI